MEFFRLHFADNDASAANINNRNWEHHVFSLGYKRASRKEADKTATRRLKGEKNSHHSKYETCDFNHVYFCHLTFDISGLPGHGLSIGKG